ncbi:MAG: hypothetical protein ACKOPS_03640 [Cyanobium sp.]
MATLRVLPKETMLPLAWSMSLLLLLSSLSLQALALQEGSLQALQQRRRQQEDQLMTAAQRLAGRLQRQHRCLLPLAIAAWPAAGCATATELAELRQGLRAYQPAPAGGDPQAPEGRVELLLQQGEGAAAFALHGRRPDPAGPPVRVALRELGLRQVQP